MTNYHVLLQVLITPMKHSNNITREQIKYVIKMYRECVNCEGKFAY
jgi:hypothetical protein